MAQHVQMLPHEKAEFTHCNTKRVPLSAREKKIYVVDTSIFLKGTLMKLEFSPITHSPNNRNRSVLLIMTFNSMPKTLLSIV